MEEIELCGDRLSIEPIKTYGDKSWQNAIGSLGDWTSQFKHTIDVMTAMKTAAKMVGADQFCAEVGSFLKVSSVPYFFGLAWKMPLQGYEFYEKVSANQHDQASTLKFVREVSELTYAGLEVADLLSGGKIGTTAKVASAAFALISSLAEVPPSSAGYESASRWKNEVKNVEVAPESKNAIVSEFQRATIKAAKAAFSALAKAASLVFVKDPSIAMAKTLKEAFSTIKLMFSCLEYLQQTPVWSSHKVKVISAA